MSRRWGNFPRENGAVLVDDGRMYDPTCELLLRVFRVQRSDYLAFLTAAKELDVSGILRALPTGAPRPLQGMRRIGDVVDVETFVEDHRSGAPGHDAGLRRRDLVAMSNRLRRSVRVLYPQETPGRVWCCHCRLPGRKGSQIRPLVANRGTDYHITGAGAR